MMGEHGGKSKKAKEAGRDGCGAPAVLLIMIVIVLLVVFRHNIADFVSGLVASLMHWITGR